MGIPSIEDVILTLLALLAWNWKRLHNGTHMLFITGDSFFSRFRLSTSM